MKTNKLIITPISRFFFTKFIQITITLFFFISCNDLAEQNASKNSNRQAVSTVPVINSIEELGKWLAAQPANTAVTPYIVMLNISDLGGNAYSRGSLGNILKINKDKYVNLDLSDSTFTDIEYGAFGGCTKLTGVTIGSNVNKIGEFAFRSCTGLTSVTIPNSVTAIGDGAFYGCVGLTGVTIPGSVTYIGRQAFSISQLTSVTIPNSVTYIGRQAFSNNQLTGVIIPGAVTEISYSAFRGNRLTGVTIPDSVKVIGESAFAGNQLTSVTIPDSVTQIDGGAFVDNQLTSITIGANVIFNDKYPYYDAFGGGFDDAYKNSGKLAGTYTRPNTDSEVWKKQ